MSKPTICHPTTWQHYACHRHKLVLSGLDAKVRGTANEIEGTLRYYQTIVGTTLFVFQASDGTVHLVTPDSLRLTEVQECTASDHAAALIDYIADATQMPCGFNTFPCLDAILQLDMPLSTLINPNVAPNMFVLLGARLISRIIQKHVGVHHPNLALTHHQKRAIGYYTELQQFVNKSTGIALPPDFHQACLELLLQTWFETEQQEERIAHHMQFLNDEHVAVHVKHKLINPFAQQRLQKLYAQAQQMCDE